MDLRVRSPLMGGGQGGKTGLYLVENMDKKIIEKNFAEIDKGKYVTTDKEKENCYAVTTAQRSRPVYRKQDNYVLEETRKVKCLGTYNTHQSGNIYNPEGISPSLCATDYKAPVKIIEKKVEEVIGSTQKHAARTDGTETPTLTASMGQGGGHVPMLKIRETTKKGYKEAKPGDGVLVERASRKIAKGMVQKDSTGTIRAKSNWGAVTGDYRIRRLTPRECERLQGFPDDWTKYGKDGELISDTQRYKCCGNAVTTTVITAIVDKMFDDVE